MGACIRRSALHSVSNSKFILATFFLLLYIIKSNDL